MRACQAQSIHRRLGTRVAEAHLLNWRKTALHFLSKVDAISTGQRIQASLAELVAQRLHQHWMRVADEQTAKAQVEISILVAIIVPDMTSLPATDEERIWRH